MEILAPIRTRQDVQPLALVVSKLWNFVEMRVLAHFHNLAVLYGGQLSVHDGIYVVLRAVNTEFPVRVQLNLKIFYLLRSHLVC